MQQTKLYSCFPADSTPELKNQIKEEITCQLRQNLRHRFHGESRSPDTKHTSRDLYLPLPWMMADLPGTTWRNAHSLQTTTVEKIRANCRGKLGPDPDEYINSMFSLGLWLGEDRFVIDHWIRIDHLGAVAQMDWHIDAIIHSVDEYHRAIQAIEKLRECGEHASCFAANFNLHKCSVEHSERRREAVIRKAKVFADENGITFIIANILNQVTVQRNQAAQLKLF